MRFPVASATPEATIVHPLQRHPPMTSLQLAKLKDAFARYGLFWPANLAVYEHDPRQDGPLQIWSDFLGRRYEVRRGVMAWRVEALFPGESAVRTVRGDAVVSRESFAALVADLRRSVPPGPEADWYARKLAKWLFEGENYGINRGTILIERIIAPDLTVVWALVPAGMVEAVREKTGPRFLALDVFENQHNVRQRRETRYTGHVRPIVVDRGAPGGRTVVDIMTSEGAPELEIDPSLSVLWRLFRLRVCGTPAVCQVEELATSCRFLGPGRGPQTVMDAFDGMCAVYVPYYAFMRAMNPTLPPDVVVAAMVGIENSVLLFYRFGVLCAEALHALKTTAPGLPHGLTLRVVALPFDPRDPPHMGRYSDADLATRFVAQRVRRGAVLRGAGGRTFPTLAESVRRHAPYSRKARILGVSGTPAPP